MSNKNTRGAAKGKRQAWGWRRSVDGVNAKEKEKRMSKKESKDKRRE